jgi:hypothetical protein
VDLRSVLDGFKFIVARLIALQSPVSRCVSCQETSHVKDFEVKELISETLHEVPRDHTKSRVLQN